MFRLLWKRELVVSWSSSIDQRKIEWTLQTFVFTNLPSAWLELSRLWSVGVLIIRPHHFLLNTPPFAATSSHGDHTELENPKSQSGRVTANSLLFKMSVRSLVFQGTQICRTPPQVFEQRQTSVHVALLDPEHPFVFKMHKEEHTGQHKKRNP